MGRYADQPASPVVSAPSATLVPWDVELYPGRSLGGTRRRLKRVTRIIKSLGGSISDTFIAQQGYMALLRAQLVPGTEEILRMVPEIFEVKAPPRNHEAGGGWVPEDQT